MNKNAQQQAGDEHRLKTVSDPDAREWIVEYQPYQATTGAWKLPSVFRQREGRKEYKKAVASADSRASMNDGKREALEREKRQIQREKRRIERQLADLDEADRVERDRQLEKEGAVALGVAVQEMARRQKEEANRQADPRNTRTLWRARNTKTGAVIPGPALGV